MAGDTECAQLVDSASSKKRKREKPNKKWTDGEVDQILLFLAENKPFEMPTAQFFYKKLIKETGISAEWNLIRWKVRNLRTSYQKATQWQNATGTGLMESDDSKTIEQKIAKICPNFNMLQAIFGSKDAATDVVMESVDFAEDALEILLNDDLSPNSGCVQASNVIEQRSAEKFAEKMKKSAPKSAISRLNALQSERNDFHIQKLQFEREKHDEEKELQGKKLKLEEDKFALERERQERVLQIEEKKLLLEQETKRQELKLKEEELAMKERLARYELELKYKK